MDIDKEVLDRIRAVSEKEGISFKDLLNRLLREGLKRPFVRQPPYEGPSFSMGPFLVPPEKALDYLDEQDDRALAERLFGREGKQS